jgi:protein-S-isoprenylcysteine O-methyltransferase Ste14
MKEYGEILLGVVLAILGVAGIWHFRAEVLAVILGVIGIIVLMVGAVFLMIGISDVREKGEEEIEMGEVAESGTEEEEKSE